MGDVSHQLKTGAEKILPGDVVEILLQTPQTASECCRMQVSKTQTSAVSHLSITIDSKCVSLQIFLSAAKPSGTAPAAVTEQKVAECKFRKLTQTPADELHIIND